LRYADRHALVSTEDEDGVEEVARGEAVAGLIAPGIDWPVAIAARIAARLALPHPVAPDVAEATVSKVRQREAFARAGVPQPRWRLVSSPEGPVELPCVVKPPDRQGQVAVSLVREPDEVRPALDEALAASRGGDALVEEWVDGPEVTVNGFSVDGRFRALTVTDRLTAEPPAFGVALAHAWPSTQAVEAAVEAAERAAAALGVREGPTYTQIRMAPDGPRVIELAARLGGGQDGDLCDAALGIDLNALAIGAALGRQVEVPPARPVGGACVAFLVPPPGVLRSVEGLEEARALQGVVDAITYRPPGWRFAPLRVGADRGGFVLTRGHSRDEALARAAAAADRIRFVVDGADEG
jgi:biotin carboxylase